MGYAFYLHNFTVERTRLGDVIEILKPYGAIERGVSGFEFSPQTDDICEYGHLAADDPFVEGISFERPVNGDKLRKIIYNLLQLPGMCFFELDVSYVLSVTDVWHCLPETLKNACESEGVTLIRSEADLAPFI